KGWNAYSAQAHQRGREVIAALEKGCPGLTVFLTYAYALPYHALHSGQCSKLEDCSQGLLKPFLDGMLERATGTTRFIDGDELVWVYTQKPRFWTEDGAPTGMPQSYLRALQRGKAPR